MDEQRTQPAAQRPGVTAIATPVKELRDSLVLLAFAASSLGVYVGLGVAAVKVLSTR